MKKSKKVYSNHDWIPMTLICLAGAALLTESFLSIKENWNCLEQKAQIELVDTSKVNYSQPIDSVYKELGIDKAKYNPKQLDSLVSEAYQTILW